MNRRIFIQTVSGALVGLFLPKMAIPMTPIYCANCGEHIANYDVKPESGMILEAEKWHWLDQKMPKPVAGEVCPPCPHCTAPLGITIDNMGKKPT